MKGWVLVTRCPDATMAPLIQGGLEAEGIPCVVMNFLKIPSLIQI